MAVSTPEVSAQIQYDEPATTTKTSDPVEIAATVAFPLEEEQQLQPENAAPSHLMEENPVLPYCENATRRRRVGFGARSNARSTSHDRLSIQFILHNTWPFMDPQSRANVCASFPDMKDYARLRYDACHHRATIIEALQAQ